MLYWHFLESCLIHIRRQDILRIQRVEEKERSVFICGDLLWTINEEKEV